LLLGRFPPAHLADGTVYTWSLEARYDGNEYPVTTIDQNGVRVEGLYKTASVKQIDANTFESSGRTRGF
jgi:hypothetical protein